jgi:hypothetical protein
MPKIYDCRTKRKGTKYNSGGCNTSDPETFSWLGPQTFRHRPGFHEASAVVLRYHRLLAENTTILAVFGPVKRAAQVSCLYSSTLQVRKRCVSSATKDLKVYRSFDLNVRIERRPLGPSEGNGSKVDLFGE